MNEYRITLPEFYPFGSLGYTDKSVRQGYYVCAENELKAKTKFRELGNNFSEKILDVELWKENV